MYPKEGTNRDLKVLDIGHSDVCGPMSTQNIKRMKFFITFTDDTSRFSMIFLLSKKSEAIIKLKNYITVTKNKFSCSTKELQIDNDGEYKSDEVTFFKIRSRYTTPVSCTTLSFTKRGVWKEEPNTSWNEALLVIRTSATSENLGRNFKYSCVFAI